MVASSAAVPRSLWAAYAGRSATVDAGADQRGLVAHDVDAVEQVGPLDDVADVEPVQSRNVGQHAVRLRQQRVDRHDLVPLLGEQPRDRRTDEAGRAGEQDPHGNQPCQSGPQPGTRATRRASVVTQP